MNTGTSAPSGEPRTVRGWLRVASDGRIEAANAALADVLGAGGPLGLIGLHAASVVTPSSQGALDAISSAALRDRGWRGRLELEGDARLLVADVDAEPRESGSIELRLEIFVPAEASAAPPVREPTTAAIDAGEPPAPWTVLREVIGEIAHELGNPLAAIAGFAEGIAELTPEEQRRALDVIEREASRAGRVLQALQTFGQREAFDAAAGELVASIRRVFAEARVDRADLDQRVPLREPVRPRILVVDDEESIRTLTAGVLQAGGYEALGAASGEEALALLEDRRFDAVITDIRMPGMSGVALHAEIARRWPELARRVVIVSGDVQTEAVATLARVYELPALEKPFRLETLRAALAEVLARGAQEAGSGGS